MWEGEHTQLPTRIQALASFPTCLLISSCLLEDHVIVKFSFLGDKKWQKRMNAEELRLAPTARQWRARQNSSKCNKEAHRYVSSFKSF